MTPDLDPGAVDTWDALYAAAEAATPGPWCLYRYERGGGRLYKHPAKLIADLYDEADGSICCLPRRTVSGR